MRPMSIIGTGVKRTMRFREWDSLKMFSKRELIIWLSYKMNALMLNGQGFDNATVRNDLLVMLGFAVFSMLIGIWLLHRALQRAHKGNGVGMVV